MRLHDRAVWWGLCEIIKNLNYNKCGGLGLLPELLTVAYVHK